MPTTKMTKSRATSSFLLRACAALCLLLAYAFTVGAQNTSPQRGFNPGGSYAISDIETISTSGGNLGLSIPLGDCPPGEAASRHRSTSSTTPSCGTAIR